MVKRKEYEVHLESFVFEVDADLSDKEVDKEAGRVLRRLIKNQKIYIKHIWRK